MITTMVHGADDRLRSYELLASAWELTAEERWPAPADGVRTHSLIRCPA